MAVAGALVALVAGVAVGGPPAGAAPGDVGVEGPAFVESALPTVTMAESKLWFHDGTWFGAMLKTGTPSSGGAPDADVVIHKRVGGTWVPTATVLDPRATSKQDVVARGNTLYVLSHKKVDVATGVPGTTPSDMARLAKLTYDTATDTYVPVTGFPVTVNPYIVESMSLDVDSTGALWTTWTQTGQVMWQRSTDGGATWSAPAALTGAHAAPTGDDISSLVAYGDRVGIMWASQAGADDGYWFTSAPAGSGPVTWTATEAAFVGAQRGDDHISLKAVGGELVAAVKSRAGNSATPLILLLRRSAAGAWTSTSVWDGTTKATRPVVAVDTTGQRVHVFAALPNGTISAHQGVYTKSAPLATPSFTPGAVGTAAMVRTGGDIADVTTTKQPLTSASGVVALAADTVTRQYWTHTAAIAPVGPPTYRPFASAAAFAEQQAQDFLRRAATPAEVAAVTQLLVDQGKPGSAAVLGPQAFGHSSVGGADLRGLQAQVARLYVAYFLRTPDKGGLDYWIAQRTGGNSLENVSQAFALSPEFRTRYGADLSDAAYVDLVYDNLFDRAPDADGRAYWIAELGRGIPRGRMMTLFAESPEYVNRSGRLVTVSLVFRWMLDRMPTAAERTAALGAPSVAALVDLILAGPEYEERVT